MPHSDRHHRGSIWVYAIVLGIGACGQDPIIVPDRSFDRPSDMVFVCLRVEGQGPAAVLTGRPMSFCRNPVGADAPVDLQNRQQGTFAVVTNTARGELGAIDMDTNRLVDLDPSIPGFNMIPVGALPETLAVSHDGCRVATANRGSCDLTVLETSRMLSTALGGATPWIDAQAGTTAGAGAAAQPVAVRTRSGVLRARPGEIAFLPQNLTGVEQKLCGAAAHGGPDVPPGPWRAVVSFPGCGLVALVDLPSGQVVDSMRITTGGLVPVGDDPVCADECNVGSAIGFSGENVAGMPDGGVAMSPVDAGMTTMDALAGTDAALSDGGPMVGSEDTSIRPSPLALLPNGSRVYVGANNAPFVTAIDIQDRSRLAAPSYGGRIPLQEGAIGTTRLRLSVDPYGSVDSQEYGRFVGDEGQYLYAIALDGSVRVVNVGARMMAVAQEMECDTNIEPSYVLDLPIGDQHKCLPAAETLQPGGPPRRLFAQGPGIRPPHSGAGSGLASPAPQDIAFASLGSRLGGGSAVQDQLDGAFGFLMLTSGEILILNIKSNRQIVVPPSTDLKQPPPNSFRNALFGPVDTRNNVGPARVVGTPVSTLSPGGAPFGVRGRLPRALVPRIEGVRPSEVEAIPDNLPGEFAYAVFPRPLEAAPDRYRIEWEGMLPTGFRNTGQIATVAPGGVAAAALSDPGADFCAMGVRPGDVVQVGGCNDDRACGDPAVFACLRATAGIPGLCVMRTQLPVLSQDCGRVLQSRRRYRVQSARVHDLTLGLLPDELVRPQVVACQTDLDCQAGEAHANFVCGPVTPGGPGRCVNPCTEDRDCREGFVCTNTGSPLGALCVAAPAIDSETVRACLDASRRYSVHGGQAFMVSSTFIPPYPTLVAGADGSCQPVPDLSPRLADRISLATAPACDPVPANAAAALAQAPAAVAGTPGGPCLFVARNNDDPAAAPGIACPDNAADTNCHVKALFENPHLRLVITNLEQPFGDGVVMAFETAGGSFPERIPPIRVELAVPARLVTSPIEVLQDRGADINQNYLYLYVVDAGRLRKTGIRGQILRVDSLRGRFDNALSGNIFQVQ